MGASDAADSRHAGAEAAGRALTGGDAQLLVVFCAGRLDPAAVLAGINEVSGGVPLIGCSTGGALTAEGPATGVVVVTAFGGPGFEVSTAAATGAGSAQREAGSSVAACADAATALPERIMVLLTDGMSTNQEEIIAGVYDVVGSTIPLVGAAASPDADAPTFLLHGTEVLTDAVVAATISSDGAFGVATRHGFRKVGEPMQVTHIADGRVLTLDDKPALPAYLDRLGAPAEAYADPVAFAEFSRTRPIGVRRRKGEEVRNVSTISDFHAAALGSSGEIPEGAVIWIMEGDKNTLLDAADSACEAAVADLGGVEPIGLVAFDCVLRAWVLTEETTSAEVARIAGHAAGRPVAGFYSYGEIARTQGINGFYHQSLAVLAVG